MSEFPLLSDARVMAIAFEKRFIDGSRQYLIEVTGEVQKQSRAPLLAEIERLSAEVERNVQSRKEAQIQNEALKGEVSRLQGLASHCDYLREQVERLKADAERLDSGTIKMIGRDSWGEDTTIHYRGINLRAAIDAARAQGDTQ